MAIYTIMTVILLFGSYHLFLNSQHGIFEKQVRDYLISQRGYKESDIASITAINSVGGDYGINVVVEFNDEPGVMYHYLRNNGVIDQLDEVTVEKRKHVEETQPKN
ncbi:DUF3139 domain-containing protein [Paenibacillus caseinilyticus]|uniref:DUF3139 domain-containing protein n=1 Tax=Paenibacillus mucilaginosus K02 TaxID=997761 RepID=I0BFD8_9BACL|nr:DUF3139 domain-containing protein [Paenibacillus mucilaginosus]AFH61085.1 hypothetical protein B2K_10175 [Paenibacillus mucilaginosus K02]